MIVAIRDADRRSSRDATQSCGPSARTSSTFSSASRRSFEPVLLALGDQSHAPGEGVAAAARDAGVDQRVQDLCARACAVASWPGTLKRGEQVTLVAAPSAPGHLALEPALGLVGDLHALAARVLAEARDPRGERGGPGLRRWRRRRARARRACRRPGSRRGRTSTSGGPDEPVVGEPAGEPALDLFGGEVVSCVLVSCHVEDYIITRIAGNGAPGRRGPACTLSPPWSPCPTRRCTGVLRRAVG